MIYERSNHFRILDGGRPMGGDGVMIWGGVGYCGKLETKFIAGKLNNKRYIETIDEQINTRATRIAGNKYIFQRDNVHTAKAVKQYFANKRIRV